MGKITGKGPRNSPEDRGDTVRNRDEIGRQVEDMALAIGNVTEACRRCGMPRRTYYAWKKAAKPQPGEGPDQAVRIRSRHPHAIPGPLVQMVIGIALENPEWGCDRIAYFLRLKGRKISSPTVQKILIRNGLGRESQRRASSGKGT